MTSHHDPTGAPSPRHPRYRVRVVVEGPVSEGVLAWLEARARRIGSDRSSLVVDVRDQSELLGRLQRMHDLHLQILALHRIEIHSQTR